MNGDGTRTDHWKMDLPHAPYLFFMGVGDYAIVKDSYKGKEVAYYVEKAYAPVARRFSAHTPEMIAFYSRDYGCRFSLGQIRPDRRPRLCKRRNGKYHRHPARRECAAGCTGADGWQSVGRVIAHELFHQWFGDLVTAKAGAI